MWIQSTYHILPLHWYVQCMIMYKQATYSTFPFSFCTSHWRSSSLFESTGSTPWFVGTKKIHLRHHFNNFQPAGLVLSVLTSPPYQFDRLSGQTSSFTQLPIKTQCYISPINIMHQPSLVELECCCPHKHSYTSTHVQTDKINGCLPPHHEELHSIRPMEESTHSQDIQLQACTNSTSLYLTHVRLGSTAFTHAPLGKYCWCVHTHTQTNIESHSVSHTNMILATQKDSKSSWFCEWTERRKWLRVHFLLSK